MIDRACISLNHRCNLKCKYCHFAGKESNIANEQYEFTFEEADQIVENIVEYCLHKNIDKFKLGIVGSGEPLISFAVLKHTVEKVRQLAENRIFIYTITNGILFSKQTVDFFYQNKDLIDVNFSLDGYEEIHNEMRQGYQKTLNAIALYEKLFGHKPLINATVTRKTVEKSDEVIEFFIKNGFTKVNFSIVSDIEDTNIKIYQDEYEAFLDKCFERGISIRQRRSEIQDTYDCAKYGRICGVGHNNIFITKRGIYPCGRFFGLEDYKLADFNEKLQEVEKKFNKFAPLEKGQCYYDTYVGGNK